MVNLAAISVILLAAAGMVPSPAPAQRVHERGAAGLFPGKGKRGAETSRRMPRVPQGGFLARAWARVRAGPRPDAVGTAADISLFASCLEAGLSTQQAAAAVSEVAGPGVAGNPWREAAALLRVGATDEQAWGSAANVARAEAKAEDAPFDEVARLITMSGKSGAAVATGCRGIAAKLRDAAAAESTAAAERAGVFISLPLALCFLPAFIVLGLVPVIISLSAQLL